MDAGSSAADEPGNRRFTRLTNALSKKSQNHDALALYSPFYNFACIHQALRVTPAMAAGVTDQLWETGDLAKLVEDAEAAPKPRRSCERRVACATEAFSTAVNAAETLSLFPEILRAATMIAALGLAAGGCDRSDVYDQPVPDFTDRIAVDRVAAKLPRRDRISFLRWSLREKKVASGAMMDATRVPPRKRSEKPLPSGGGSAPVFKTDGIGDRSSPPKLTFKRLRLQSPPKRNFRPIGIVRFMRGPQQEEINCNRRRSFMKSKLTLLSAAAALAWSAPALAQNPAAQPNNTPISLSGTVVSAGPDSFMLDYGDGLITVEMDDFDAWAEAAPLLEGDRVSVYGDVDNDLFHAARIEANSVYVQGLNTTFFANDADEEDFAAFYAITPTLNNVNVTGIVKQIDASQGAFQLDTGQAEVRVETDELGYNPLDRHGYQQIALGDRLFVSGEVDRDFFQRRALDAETIVTLNRAPRGDS